MDKYVIYTILPFLAVMLAACGGSPEPPVTVMADPAPAHEEGMVAASDGVQLYYRKVGSADRTVILPSRLLIEQHPFCKFAVLTFA